jgi:hypothetical protein
MGPVAWGDFTQRALRVAAAHGALVAERGGALVFSHPRADDRVELSSLDDGDAVSVRAGWFIRFVVEIDTARMRAIALADVDAVLGGGAVEYIAVQDGRALPAGFAVQRSGGGSHVSEFPVPDGLPSYAHRLAPWRSR